jgi:hypothetical protein
MTIRNVHKLRFNIISLSLNGSNVRSGSWAAFLLACIVTYSFVKVHFKALSVPGLRGVNGRITDEWRSGSDYVSMEVFSQNFAAGPEERQETRLSVCPVL